jgi:hypothetical protein
MSVWEERWHLGRRGADITMIADAYAARTGHRHRRQVFSASSPGAAAFGHLRLVPRATLETP